MSTASKEPVPCPGCKVVFRSMGALGNHAKNSKTCTPEMRFWGKVKKTRTCWLWQGAPNQKGYGQTTYAGRKNLVVHRLIWMMNFGHIPDGMEVCHKCDVRNCIRPSHLFLGTHLENMQDCVAKDRHTRGARNQHAKLTDEQVREIKRDFLRTGFKWTNADELSARYQIGKGQILAIARGDSWKHVK